MPTLRVSCARCNTAISTGMEMSYEAFRNATFTTHTIECPSCEHVQTWTLDDVDRSVFKAPASK